MLRIGRRPLALLLALLLPALAAGCTDDDGGSGAGEPASTATVPPGAIGAGLDLDACALVTREQVEEIAGFASGSPVSQTFGLVDACEYRAADPDEGGVVTLAVLSGGGVGADAYDAAEQMGGEPIEGLGDEALCLEVGGEGSSTSSGTVTVLVGADVLQAVTDSCETSEALLAAALGAG